MPQQLPEMAASAGDGRSVLHVDMDAFFASVEQLDRPETRGQPLVVGADPGQGTGRGVVAACSYEARRYGIHSAMPISRAWKLCPQAVYLRPRMSRYRELSRRVFDVFHAYSDRVEPLSIDEAFVDLTGTSRLFGSAVEVAQAIKGTIRRDLGLVASVGLAPNKFVAKVASDLEKPDGFVVVPEGSERAFLAPLPVERLWGVGPKTARALRERGVGTIGDLAHRRVEDLRARFGDLGEHLWQLSRGVDQRPVVSESEPKTIGAETTFLRDVDDGQQIRSTLLELSDKVAARLRADRLAARRVTLKFRDETFTTLTRSLTVARATNLADDLHDAVLDLLAKIDRKGRKVRLVGVTAGRLESVSAAAGGQVDLFDGAERARKTRLACTIDHIRSRFGGAAIVRGSYVSSRSPARDAGETE